ncbi:MAG: outer membrane protein transport protein, partial [Acidobacteria bacterium]|nr:outer membrane protein transport protein [Acidobacteriota bacterium]
MKKRIVEQAALPKRTEKERRRLMSARISAAPAGGSATRTHFSSAFSGGEGCKPSRRRHSPEARCQRSVSSAKGSILVLLLFLALPAYGGAWKLEIMGGKALGSAYAGNAVITEDASSVWFNPAAMTYLDETTLTGGSAFIDLSIEHNDLGTTSLLGQPINGPRVTEGGSFFPVPHGYMVVPVSDRLSFGIGFNTPFGLGTDYGETWVGRYQAVNTELLVYNLNPSVAWRVSEQLSIGGGINIQYADGAFGEMIDFGSIGAVSGLPLVPQQHDGKVEITGDDWMVGYNIGAIWEPIATTRLGATFRSGTTAKIEGPADFVVPPEAEALTGGGVFFQDSEAVAELPMPRTSSLSISHALSPRLKVLGDVTWTDWSEFAQLVIEFDDPTQDPVVQVTDWDDALRVSLGGEYEMTDRWIVRFGVADEPTPVRVTLALVHFDAHRAVGERLAARIERHDLCSHGLPSA